MAWLLCINEQSKRAECEIGDIVAVYSYDPTPVERKVFDCIKVCKVKASEIQETITGKMNPARESKYGASVDCLTKEDVLVMKTASSPIKEIRNRLGKIRAKMGCAVVKEKVPCNPDVLFDKTTES